eukprot:TRINITY_DN13_c3_g1_i1.p1 TRINITY_DN13_c3_g1~~TRINITY_DN13_c3_g1_i1.p1  ORF type:complete len:198 (+),score=82.72 TRINITY_DN13_c3_g1_i1:115-708(+)
MSNFVIPENSQNNANVDKKPEIPKPKIEEITNDNNNNNELNEKDSNGNNNNENKPAETPAQTTPKRRLGRRKIEIEFIEDKSRRQITFSKRKAGLMKKAYELTTLTGTQALLLVASETGHVYTFATPKLQPFVTLPEGKNLIQQCLNAPDQPIPANDDPNQLPNNQVPQNDMENPIQNNQMGYVQNNGTWNSGGGFI